MQFRWSDTFPHSKHCHSLCSVPTQNWTQTHGLQGIRLHGNIYRCAEQPSVSQSLESNDLGTQRSSSGGSTLSFSLSHRSAPNYFHFYSHKISFPRELENPTETRDSEFSSSSPTDPRTDRRPSDGGALRTIRIYKNNPQSIRVCSTSSTSVFRSFAAEEDDDGPVLLSTFVMVVVWQGKRLLHSFPDIQCRSDCGSDDNSAVPVICK